jgi:thiamine biosynthesis protein ThiS
MTALVVSIILGTQNAADYESPLVMKLQINGENRDFESSLTLTDLIERLGMKQDRVAVELNRDIVPREQWSETLLKEGDRLEIVHFVGGGVDAGVIAGAASNLIPAS